jgi:predicted MFS family arabinose efflux permease
MSSRRSFGIFWVVQTLSVAGDMFSFVAIPLLVLASTGSVARMGLLTAAAGVGRIVAGFFAGTIVDRFDRRRLLIGCDAARAVVLGAVVVSPSWILYLVSPLAAAAGMVFQVAYVAAVPNLVDPDRITEANGRLNATYAAATIVGPMLAGLVSHAFGPALAIGIDAVTFAISAGGVVLIRLRPSPRGATDPRKDFLVGVRFLARHPALRSLTALLTLQIFLTTGLEDVFIYFLKHDLGQDDRVVGYVLAVAGIGSIVAALIVARARRWLGFGVCWIGSVAIGGLALALVGIGHTLVLVAVLVTVFTFSLGVGGVCSMSLRQQVTPNELLGRVTAAFWTVHYALAPAGAALLTALAGRVGAPVVCLAAGVGCVAIAGAALLTPVRLSHPETAFAPPLSATPERTRANRSTGHR